MQARFKPRARIMQHLGEQLIKNESVAVLELVKNAYDAYATEVSVHVDVNNGVIEISDNGTGMDEDTVNNIWFEPGTDNKEKELEEIKKDRFYTGRVPLGEKGIGRFGVHKLGNEIELITRCCDEKEIYLNIDWSKFKATSYLEDVPIDVVLRKPVIFKNKTHGTHLIISSLKKEMTRGTVRKIYRDLMNLHSPFDYENKNKSDTFKVNMTCSEDWLDDIDTIESLLGYAMHTLDATIENDTIEFKYEFKPLKVFQNIESRTKSVKNEKIVKTYKIDRLDKQKTVNLGNYKIGTVKIKLLIFDRDAKVINIGIPNKKLYQDYLNEQCGIRLYRDNVVIYGVGGSENDWLGLESRRINSPASKLSRKNVIGAVYLDRIDSKDIVENTNREGLIENDAYEALIDSVLALLSMVETERNIDKSKVRSYFAGNGSTSEPVVDSIRELRDIVNDKIKDKITASLLTSQIDRIEEDYKYINSVYLRSANSGMGLSIVIHEVEKIVSELKSASNVMNVDKHLQKLVSDLDSVINGFSELIRTGKPELITLSDLVNLAKKNIRYRLRAHVIDFVIDLDFDASQIKVSKSLVVGMIINLIDNSIYWMEHKDAVSGLKNKVIRVFSEVMDDRVSLIIADNGTGFRINADDALKPFISGKPNGMGLGLHLAHEIMKMNNGIISIRNPVEFDLPQPEFETGAVVALTFKLEENQ